MCNKHAIIINLKREDIAARRSQILHNLGVVGAQTCPHHKTSVIIYNFVGLYWHLFSTNDLQIGKLTCLKVLLFSHVGRFLLTDPSQKFEKKIDEMIYCPVFFVLKLLSQGLHFYRAVKVTVGPGL